MRIRIETGSTDPLYAQIGAQLRKLIVEGELVAGDRLPAAKELAAGIGVNVHTVLRAYAELRDAGLIELRPRRGAVVRSEAPIRARLTELVRQAVAIARVNGLTKSDVLELVSSEW